MSSTDLQVQFHDFAGGRPALALSVSCLEKVVSNFGQSLAGNYPDRPSAMMRNIKMPVFNLAYSGFLRVLKLDLGNGRRELFAELIATVHPYDDPAKVIATYEVTFDAPLEVDLSYSQSSRELRWASKTVPFAKVNPKLSSDAERILKELQVTEPVLETYGRTVESAIVWNTSSTFAQLVLDALPPIDLAEIAPWLTFIYPIQIDYGNRYLVVTAEKSRMTIGGCSPVDVIVEQDPSFPYEMPSPVESYKSRVSVAVYLPKSRILEFVAKNVMPAVMYDSGERGGIVKWRMAGAFGLDRFTVDVSGGIQIGNPQAGNITLKGTLSTSTAIALTGVARAWVNGPCGSRVGLASASILGNGEFGADIIVTYKSPGGPSGPDYGAILEAELLVTRSQLDPNIEIDAVGWPIDGIISELADHLVSKEVQKLSRTVRQLGRWDVAGAPSWLVEILTKGSRLGPVVESLSGVSSIVGFAERRG